MRSCFRLLGLLMGLWCLSVGFTVAHGQYASVRWSKVDETQAALFLDGVQAGNYRLADGKYFPCEGGGFGPATECPVEVPEEYRPKAPEVPDWRVSGVIAGKSTPGVTIGGDPAEVARVTRQAEASVTIPAFQRMPSITVVSKDRAARERIRDDFQAHEALAAFRDHRVKAYDPGNPLLAPFKLGEDARFAETGLVILVQPAPDVNNRAPVTSLYEYNSAEEVAGRLRVIEVEYDPTATEFNEYSRWDVGLGVGLGTTGILSLLLGGLWKWLR